MNKIHLLSAVTTAILLSGCGGGGGGSTEQVIEPGTAETLLDMSRVTVSDTPNMPENWYQGAVFMEIYVRGYVDTDGDGIGDFKGVTSKLDYLQDLGVEGIWLLPVNQSSDNDHGYEVTDYRAMESDYGSREDFDELVREAHARGIGIIMDYVVNHSSGANPLFLDSDKNLGGKRNWYMWEDSEPQGWYGYNGPAWHPGSSGYYYGRFQHYMPDFNLENPEVMDFHFDNLRYWMNAGIDGFRFDAVAELVENGPGELQHDQPENEAILKSLQNVVSEEYSHRYMVCEDPASPTQAALDSRCGSAFAFGLNYAVMAALKTGLSGQNLSSLDYIISNYPLQKMGLMLANHDEFAGHRIYEQLNGDIAKYKVAAATLMTLPGQPFIYYGEEVGMGHNSFGGDWGMRSPMSWTSSGGFSSSSNLFRPHANNLAQYNLADQVNDPDSLYNHYKVLANLRKSNQVLKLGDITPFIEEDIVAFLRSYGGEQVLVVMNYSDNAQTLNVSSLGNSKELIPLAGFGNSGMQTDSSGDLSLPVAAHEVQIYALQ